jgi:hypothetical protein
LSNHDESYTFRDCMRYFFPWSFHCFYFLSYSPLIQSQCVGTWTTSLWRRGFSSI